MDKISRRDLLKLGAVGIATVSLVVPSITQAKVIVSPELRPDTVDFFDLVDIPRVRYFAFIGPGKPNVFDGGWLGTLADKFIDIEPQIDGYSDLSVARRRLAVWLDEEFADWFSGEDSTKSLWFDPVDLIYDQRCRPSQNFGLEEEVYLCKRSNSLPGPPALPEHIPKFSDWQEHHLHSKYAIQHNSSGNRFFSPNSSETR